MKRYLILVSMIVMSCSHNVETQNDGLRKMDNADFAKELIDNDYLKYADKSKVDSLKVQLSKSFDIYDENIYKIVHVDAEELAEFNFDFFIPNLNGILAKRGFLLTVKKLNDNSLKILMNGDTIQLYTQKEIDNNTFWDTSPKNFFRKVNQLLKSKQYDEQFYLLYSGNDLQTLLLTKKQFSIILEYNKDNEKEKPYEP